MNTYETLSMNGEEGNLRKRLAGQKRDMGKRLASEIGDQVDMPGHRVTRSLSVTVVLLKDERVRHKCHSHKCPFSEEAKTIEATNSKDPYEGLWPFVSSSNTEKVLETGGKENGSQDPLSSSESDHQLRNMFLEWAKLEEKRYESEEEQEKRFKIWCSNKKDIDQRYSHEPGYTFSIDYMNLFADMTDLEAMMGAPSNLGKPLAGQKRDMGKQLALEIGDQEKQGAADESVAGWMATSSVTRSLSNKGSQDPVSSSESDELRNMFLEWAKKKGINYVSEEEREERFKSWCYTKEAIDRSNSRTPGYTFSIDDLDGCADMPPSELRKLFGGANPIGRDPHKGRPPPAVLMLWKSEKGLKLVEKGKVEFKKWVVRHKKQYGNLDNMRKIELGKKLNPGYWTYGYDLENMDKYAWECSLIPRKKTVAPCNCFSDQVGNGNEAI